MNAMQRTKKTRRTLVVEEPVADINTTPLIDVMLVLLVMLIITIPIQLHNVNLQLPVGTPPVSAGELDEKMTQLAAMTPQPEVHIRPNKDCSYAVFANVLSTSKRKGLTKMAVVGHEQFVK